MPTFNIGLTMAGAISAGAYTAGVFDFLIEALEEWEKRKKELREAGEAEENWDVPSHDVVIPVMSGASAGGIVEALSVISLAEQPDPGSVPQKHPYTQVGIVTTNLPRLYKAWVTMPRFVAPDGESSLLGTEDLAKGPVASLLDTTLLSEIVTKSFENFKGPGPARPYLAEEQHIFLTHTNLRGVPYEIGFQGGANDQPGYAMLSHADRLHFVMTGIGTAKFHSPWAAPDPAQRIDASTLPGQRKPTGVWCDFAQAALGTGAFPIGLRAREIKSLTVGDYEDRQWPIDYLNAQGNQVFKLPPKFPPQIGYNKNKSVDFVASDGGVIDNEPFQLARWTLMQNPPDKNERNIKKSEQAVIMIDPFPEPPAYDVAGSLDVGLPTVLGKLISALQNQVRFKPNDLVAALDDEVGSRFLVAPRRRQGKGRPVEDFPIACGLLGGFGGFLDEEFRAHDYQLGRFNCYWFLKNNLVLPEENVILKQGYGPTGQWDRFRPDPSNPPRPTPHLQLIPLVGTAADEPIPPVWPRVTEDTLETMVKHANKRLNALVKKATSDSDSSWGKRIFFKLIWTMLAKGPAKKAIRWWVLKDLLLRDQIEGTTAGLPSDACKVFAALTDTNYDLRTVTSIAREYELEANVVIKVLSQYSIKIHKGPKAPNGEASYTLESRKPSMVRRGRVLQYLTKLKID